MASVLPTIRPELINCGGIDECFGLLSAVENEADHSGLSHVLLSQERAAANGVPCHDLASLAGAARACYRDLRKSSVAL